MVTLKRNILSTIKKYKIQVYTSMKEFPFEILFYVQNTTTLITSLRTITSTFILDECIYPVHDIYLKPYKDKLIEFKKEERNGDVVYLEHPQNLKLNVRSSLPSKRWDRTTYYDWIQSIVKLSFNYETLNTILNRYMNEMDTTFEKSINHLDLLYHLVPSLEKEMIHPYVFLYYELNIKEYEDMNFMDWESMLLPHIDSMSIIYSQIINPRKKEQICIEVFESIKILSSDIHVIVNHESTLEEAIRQFKKEIFRILNHYTFYVDTKNINFRTWFLSLSQFFLHLKPISFSLRKAILKLNMILFLSLNVDELQISNKVKYTSFSSTHTKKMKEKELKSLCKIHPFIRAVHHDEIF